MVASPPQETDVAALEASLYVQQKHKYNAEKGRRVKFLEACARSTDLQAFELATCKKDVIHFIQTYCYLLEPRNPALGLPAEIPWLLYDQQKGLLTFITQHYRTGRNGLVEKPRGAGWSWLFLTWSLWMWLFVPGFKATFGTYKLDAMDKIGDPDTLFEKLRYQLQQLPRWMWPDSFTLDKHTKLNLLINPNNGATISGVGGKSIGTGGRSSIFFFDEHRLIENASAADSAVGHTTNCVMYGSTPGEGPHVLYNQKRFSFKDENVYTLTWQGDPMKSYTAERYDPVEDKQVTYYPWRELQDEKYDPLLNRRELDLDYFTGSGEQLIPGKYIQAAFELQLTEGSVWTSGLDVSGDGNDKTVYTHRRGGTVVRQVEIEGDNSGQKVALIKRLCLQDETHTLFYDRMSVGESITATLKSDEANLPFEVIGIANAETPTNTKYEDIPKVAAHDRFVRYSDELWWRIYLRMKRSYERFSGIAWHADEDCLSLYRLKEDKNIGQLKAQLSQPIRKPTSTDKMKVDKYGAGTASPDRAESLMYAYAAQWYVKAQTLETYGSTMYQGSR